MKFSTTGISLLILAMTLISLSFCRKTSKVLKKLKNQHKSHRLHRPDHTEDNTVLLQELHLNEIASELTYSNYNNMNFGTASSPKYVFQEGTSKLVQTASLAYLYGISSVDPSMFILSLRGTVNLCNLKDDLRFAPVDYDTANCEGCKVHKGFIEAYNEIKTQVLDVVDAKLKKFAEGTQVVKRVLITGHSLGGALSELVTNDLIEKYVTTKVEADKTLGSKFKFYNVNFGKPRVGNEQWANHINKFITDKNLERFVRVTFANDLIPKVPANIGDFKFVHPGTEIHFEYKSYIWGGVNSEVRYLFNF